MTAIAAQPARQNNGGLLFLLALIALAMGVTIGLHATKHVEADPIRKCLDQNGPQMVWWDKNADVYYLLCQLQDKSWGVQAVTPDGREKTAFVPKDGTWARVRAYLEGFARPYKGPLPWIK